MTVSCTDDSTLKFIGLNDSGIVTETKDFNQSNGATKTFEWTPTKSETTKLRLRSYETSKAGLMATTELDIV